MLQAPSSSPSTSSQAIQQSANPSSSSVPSLSRRSSRKHAPDMEGPSASVASSVRSKSQSAPNEQPHEEQAPVAIDNPTPWKNPAELPYLSSDAWSQDLMLSYLCRNAFSVPKREAKTTIGVVHITMIDGSVVVLPRGYRVPLMFIAAFQWDSVRLVFTSPEPDKEWNEYKFDIIHLARLCQHLFRSAREASQPGGKGIDKAWRCATFDRVLTRFWHKWFVSQEWYIHKFWEEFEEEEYHIDPLKYDWIRWALKGHKGFFLTKPEVQQGITAEEFMRGLARTEDGHWSWDPNVPIRNRPTTTGDPPSVLPPLPVVPPLSGPDIITDGVPTDAAVHVKRELLLEKVPTLAPVATGQEMPVDQQPVSSSSPTITATSMPPVSGPAPVPTPVPANPPGSPTRLTIVRPARPASTSAAPPNDPPPTTPTAATTEKPTKRAKKQGDEATTRPPKRPRVKSAKKRESETSEGGPKKRRRKAVDTSSASTTPHLQPSSATNGTQASTAPRLSPVVSGPLFAPPSRYPVPSFLLPVSPHMGHPAIMLHSQSALSFRGREGGFLPARALVPTASLIHTPPPPPPPPSVPQPAPPNDQQPESDSESDSGEGSGRSSTSHSSAGTPEPGVYAHPKQGGFSLKKANWDSRSSTSDSGPSKNLDLNTTSNSSSATPANIVPPTVPPIPLPSSAMTSETATPPPQEPAPTPTPPPHSASPTVQSTPPPAPVPSPLFVMKPLMKEPQPQPVLKRPSREPSPPVRASASEERQLGVEDLDASAPDSVSSTPPPPSEHAKNLLVVSETCDPLQSDGPVEPPDDVGQTNEDLSHQESVEVSEEHEEPNFPPRTPSVAPSETLLFPTHTSPEPPDSISSTPAGGQTIALPDISTVVIPPPDDGHPDSAEIEEPEASISVPDDSLVVSAPYERADSTAMDLDDDLEEDTHDTPTRGSPSLPKVIAPPHPPPPPPPPLDLTTQKFDSLDSIRFLRYLTEILRLPPTERDFGPTTTLATLEMKAKEVGLLVTESDVSSPSTLICQLDDLAKGLIALAKDVLPLPAPTWEEHVDALQSALQAQSEKIENLERLMQAPCVHSQGPPRTPTPAFTSTPVPPSPPPPPPPAIATRQTTPVPEVVMKDLQEETVSSDPDSRPTTDPRPVDEPSSTHSPKPPATLSPDATMIDDTIAGPPPSIQPQPPVSLQESGIEPLRDTPLGRTVSSLMRNVADLLESSVRLTSGSGESPSSAPSSAKGKEKMVDYDSTPGQNGTSLSVASPFVSILLGEIKAMQEDMRRNAQEQVDGIEAMRLVYRSEVQSLRDELRSQNEARKREVESLVRDYEGRITALQEDIRRQEEAMGRRMAVQEGVQAGLGKEVGDVKLRVGVLERAETQAAVARAIAMSMGGAPGQTNGVGVGVGVGGPSGSSPSQVPSVPSVPDSTASTRHPSPAAQVQPPRPVPPVTAERRSHTLPNASSGVRTAPSAQVKDTPGTLSAKPFTSSPERMDVDGPPASTVPLPAKSKRKHYSATLPPRSRFS